MQMLARRSDEGKLSGLGWLDGEVRRFDVSQFPNETHLPHMGWNDVRPRDCSDLFRDLAEESRFYFLHSYYFAPATPEYVLAELRTVHFERALATGFWRAISPRKESPMGHQAPAELRRALAAGTQQHEPRAGNRHSDPA